MEVAGGAGGRVGRSAHTPDRQPGCSQPNPARQGSSALPARCPWLTALLVGCAQVHEQLKGLVHHPVGPRRGAVHLVHHHHNLRGPRHG